MNLKNSWRELRIWMGWKRDRMANFYFMFIAVGIVLITTSKDPIYKFNLFLGGLSLSVAFLVLWSIAISKKPCNWRLVIEDAEKFQKVFEENSDVEYWISFTGREKIGKPLFKIVANLRKIKQLEGERDRLKSMYDTIPVQIIDLEMDIRNLKDEIA